MKVVRNWKRNNLRFTILITEFISLFLYRVTYNDVDSFGGDVVTDKDIHAMIDGEAAVIAAKFVKLLALSDKFFDGKLLIVRDKGQWFVMLGTPPFTEAGTMEVLEGPCGPTFMKAVEEALKRAAPLSEEQ